MNFEDMTYNPMIDGYLWKEYPRFRTLIPPDNWTAENFNNLFQAIILFSDRESPLAEERDIPKRWEKIYKTLAIKPGSPVHTEIEAYGPIFRALMHSYFMLLNDTEYELWLSLKIHFHQMSMALRESLFNARNIESALNVRQKIAAAMPELRERIQEAEARLFRDEYLQKLIADAAIEDELGGWAEKFARVPDWMN